MIHKIHHLQSNQSEHDLSAFAALHHLAPSFDLDELCFIDIETTGFDRIKSQITVIGLLVYNKPNWELHQLFCESRSDEKLVLSQLLHLLQGIKCLITFNGNSFDIPYLKSKLLQRGLPDVALCCCSLDLFDVAKQVYTHQKGLRLKDIERYLGINRTDQISGKEVVEAYFNYLRTGNLQAVDDILLHNFEDILNLPALLPLMYHLPESPSRLVIPSQLLPGLYLCKAILRGNFIECELYAAPVSNNAPTENVPNKPWCCQQDYLSPFCEYQHDRGLLKLKLPVIVADDYAVLDIQQIFNKPFSSYGDQLTPYILHYKGELLIPHLQTTLLETLQHWSLIS